MQKMDRNTAAQAHDASGTGDAGEWTAPPNEKHNQEYEKHRPTMAATIVQLATGSFTKATEQQLLKAARLMFTRRATEDIDGLNLYYLATDTLRRLQKDGHLSNHQAPGAQKKLSDRDAERALELLIAGNGLEGEEFIGYRSVNEALVECPEMRRIQEDSGVTKQTLLRRMQDAHRDKYGRKLRKITIRFKPKLTDEVKQERRKAARRWNKWPLKKMLRVVWIDEKAEYLRPSGSIQCYARPGAVSFARSSSAPLGKAPKLKYEAAVAAWCGPLYFKAITGTTGLSLGYRVRTIPSRADFDPALL